MYPDKVLIINTKIINFNQFNISKHFIIFWDSHMKKFYISLVIFFLAYVLLTAQNQYWTVFNKSNSQLPDDTVIDIVRDNDGNIWLCTWEGIVKYHDGLMTAYTPAKGNFPDTAVSCMAQFENYYWFGTYKYGLIRFDGSAWVCFNKQNKALPNNYVYCLLTGIDNSLWIGTDSGLVKYQNGNWTVFSTENSSLTSNQVYAIAKDHEGRITIGSNNQISTMDNGHWTTELLEEKLKANFMHIYCLCYDKSDNLWIGTDNGLILKKNNEWILFNTTNSALISNWIRDIACDSAGVIWIGTSSYSSDKGGLCRFDGEHSTSFNCDNTPLANDYIISVLSDSDFDIWVGTNSGGAAVFHTILTSIPDVHLVSDGIRNIKIINGSNNGKLIEFIMDKPCHLKAMLYGVLGENLGIVADGEYGMGANTIDLNLRNFSPGVYFMVIVPENMKPCVVKMIKK